MQCLGVNDHLATIVVDNQDSDGSAARIEGLLQAVIEVGLVENWQGLLHITGLGHGNNFRYTVSLQIKQILIVAMENLPVPSWRSRTRYCFRMGPRMVWTTTLGAGLWMDEDSSWSCLVKRSTPR